MKKAEMIFPPSWDDLQCFRWMIAYGMHWHRGIMKWKDGGYYYELYGGWDD